MTDPRGQAHLTAAGALLSLRDALRLRSGLVFPEQCAASTLPDELATLGVEVELAVEAASPVDAALAAGRRPPVAA